MSRPTTLSVAEALEVVRAKSARWASTFDPTDGTVLCRRREYARRADGTIVGLSLGRAVARTVEVRRPVVEVAAELQAQTLTACPSSALDGRRATCDDRAMPDPHVIVVRVYFAEVARTADVAWNVNTSAYLSRLKCDRGTYLATTRTDYLFLRPYELTRS